MPKWRTCRDRRRYAEIRLNRSRAEGWKLYNEAMREFEQQLAAETDRVERIRIINDIMRLRLIRIVRGMK